MSLIEGMRSNRWAGMLAICAVIAFVIVWKQSNHPSELGTARALSAVRATLSAPSLKNEATGSSAMKRGEQVVFEGACDASGAVPIDDRHFALADDEDNLLRIYDAERGGKPLRSIDLNPQLALQDDKKKKKKKSLESDLEAATSIGNQAYWLSSHGRNKSGKLKEERLVFFSTNLPQVNGALRVIGEPYRDLVDDMVAEPSLQAFHLDAAQRLAPKAPGGLNFEGLTATPEGSLLVGLRSPIPEGNALLVPIENPSDLVWGTKPRFGAPLLLQLGGLGIRALSTWRGRYLVVAGPPAAGQSELFVWDGPGTEVQLVQGAAEGLNPEAFFTPEDREQIMLLSDDGTQMVQGVECKSAPIEAQHFRGQWLTLTYAKKRGASAQKSPHHKF